MIRPGVQVLLSRAVLGTGERRRARLITSSVLAAVMAVTSTMAQAAGPDAAADDEAPDFSLITEAIGIIEDRFVDETAITSENLTSGAIRGMVEALGDDGHTVFLTAEDLALERAALDGRVSGVGVVVDHRAGSPRVISVIDGSPADLAGVHGGDVIVSVDGSDTTRLPIDELADLIRGDVDTVVRLGLERVGEADGLIVDIVRGNIEIDPASWALLPGSDVALLRLVQFSSGSGEAGRAAVEAALEAGATGFVLDLRGNPGGLVDEALAVAGLFLESGTAYLEQGRDGPPREVLVGGGDAVAPDIPLVVLVDYGTASAAEILAAALRDNGRASIVGERTFGTGTVLNTFTLSDGSALRIGIAQWLTPSGTAVFRVGLSPDIEVELPSGSLALDPADIVAMTALELEHSGDRPLLNAIELIDS